MKKLFTTIISCGAMLILMTPLAFAQTPDGETPANEGVCDVLQGSTSGLYGLCIAFCEAQDYADVLAPITEEDLAALENSAPSGKILANYNKKKQDSDPDMPCIKVEEPCPCWSEADLAEIDGVMWDGAPSNSPFPSAEPNGRSCFDQGPPITIVFAYEIDRLGGSRSTTAQAIDAPFFDPRLSRCQFRRFRNGPDGTSTNITLDFNAETITLEQVDACLVSLRNFQATSGFCVQIDP